MYVDTLSRVRAGQILRRGPRQLAANTPNVCRGRDQSVPSCSILPFETSLKKVCVWSSIRDQNAHQSLEASQKWRGARPASGVATVERTVPGGTHLEAYLSTRADF